MGQLADSLRSIIQTMKEGDEIFRQDIKKLEESAEALVEASDKLTKASTDLISDIEA